ncbi:MAG: HlyD family efflux transporter periplasmic adaptor subunit [Acidobacteria bacterium]|nr:MAG: HlyD family efflux transporter periplasmic adaptor subunit [Acidobacteriota bacterium]
MTRRLFIVILGLVVLASIAVYVITRPPSKGLVLTGLVDADSVSVSSQIAGRLQQVLVDEGESVTKGQLLATIVPRELQADQSFYASSMKSASAQVGAARASLKFQELQTSDQIRQAEANLSATEAQLKQSQANLELARQNYTRTAGLFKQQIVSQQQQDQAEATLQTAQANVESVEKQVQAARAAVALARSNAEQVTMRERQLAANQHQFRAAQAQDQAARARLDYTEIRSPINGLVTLRAALTGEVVNPAQAIVVLYDPDKLWVRADVPETDIHLIRIGERLAVSFPGGLERTGTVYLRGVDAEYATQRDVSRTKRDIKTFEVRLRVDNQDRRLAPGLTAFVTVPVNDGQ